MKINFLFVALLLCTSCSKELPSPSAVEPDAPGHHLEVHWVTVANTRQLLEVAPLVVLGHAVGRRIVANEKGPGTTFTRFEVDRTVRGAPLSTLELEQLGDDSYQATDAPVLRETEEALLFLSGSGPYHVVGGYQGRVNVKDGVAHPLSARTHPASGFDLDQYEGKPIATLLAEVFPETVSSVAAANEPFVPTPAKVEVAP